MMMILNINKMIKVLLIPIITKMMIEIKNLTINYLNNRLLIRKIINHSQKNKENNNLSNL